MNKNLTINQKITFINNNDNHDFKIIKYDDLELELRDDILDILDSSILTLKTFLKEVDPKHKFYLYEYLESLQVINENTISEIYHTLVFEKECLKRGITLQQYYQLKEAFSKKK